MWEVIAEGAAAENDLWAEALVPDHDRRLVPVFSPLTREELRLGVETIYEGYLVHYGHPRLFAPADDDMALLLGDYLYAHGLVRVAETGNVKAVADLSELISLCAQGRAEPRAERRNGDGAAWAATASRLGEGGLESARDELRLRGDPTALEAAARASAGDEQVSLALETHARLVG